MQRRTALTMLIALALLMLTPGFAAAAQQAAGGDMPWESGLETVMNALTGTTARIIGIIAIAGAGFAIIMSQGQAITRVLWVVVGIGLALQAGPFLNTLFGQARGALF